jgi:RHS repeat-associated protein
MQTRTKPAGVRLHVGHVVAAVWLSSVLAIAWPAGLTTDTVRITPVLIQKQSAPSLPPEVQTLEAQTAPAAFDRDTVTEHTSFADGSLVAVLDGPTEVRSIKVYGAAPYGLSVQAEVNGAWQPVSGLQNLNLATRPDGWNSFDATGPVTTAKLRFTLTAASGGSATGIKGIEVWGKGARANVRNSAALLTALLGASPPTHARIYRSSLAQGVIGAAAGGTDDPADNSFNFALDRKPADFKRVYLAYQVLGLSHWVHAVRSINGATPLGGFVRPLSTTWSTQIEEINPQWLAQGPNVVTFSAPQGASGTFTVKDVFLIAELESGANFVSGASDNQEDATNPAAAVLDGDATTGWTPYPGGNAVQADIPTLTFAFDKRTQLEGLALNLVGNLKGTIAVEFLKDGVWNPSGAAAVAGGKLITGWNTIGAPSGSGVDAARLVFSGGKGSNAEIKELVLSGSGTGPVFNPPVIAVSFPDAGQFFGRLAHLRGFLEPRDNGSGGATLTVGGAPVATNDGGFAVSLSKDDVGLVSQGDGETWAVEVKAVYPNGQTITRTVTLNNWQPAVESTATNLLPTYSQSVPPGQAKKMVHDAATLDIPANALQFETTIGITPLGDTDLPALDTGMTNVTKGPRKGYRYTPTPMKFAAKVKVTLPYSQAAIPPGLTEQDVRTFYFDKQTGSWKVLERESIDPQGNTITSLTDHFTDMINATVTVPDHPLAATFNPTQIKDIKAADPGSQVNLIEAPKVHNQGDARLSYTIDVPPGRHGLQPQLAVQYNSSGSNGWMGLGWDLPMQAVTIDTRFGVPRYEAGLETETYMLAGEMLTPVAHRGELVGRTPDKVFHARIEGQFKRIIRRGSNPSNYSWEVTDKNGVKYLYGATDPATETLADAAGNRFLWALCEIRDPNGNFVKFRYTRVDDPGILGGSVPGRNIYLSRVTYTGSGTTEGQYAVSFMRDRELTEPRRPDVQIDAKGGFKRVTADLLRRIDVTFANALVRRYEFRYNENPYGDNRPGTAFNKTLLTSVSQFGADGVVFNRHTFLYNDEARDANGNYRGFAGATNWGIGDDGIGIGLLGQGTASAVGGSQSLSAGGHLYIGFGTGADVTSKVNTAGPKFGFSQSSSEMLITMADMNGDGLPDKVFKDGSGFFYRPNQSGPNGTTTFGERVQLPTLPAISRDRVTSTTFGAESYLGGIALMVDANRANTQNHTYFSDVNGDGITDLVSGGQVLFGFINAAGVPTFSANSADTPVPIGPGAILTENLLEDAAAIVAERAANFPLLDTLRRWVAPYDGVISINAPVRLLQDATVPAAEQEGADGVRVAIQLEGAELWFTTIAANDFDPKTPTAVGAVPVTRGQRLYFRVQSVFDGRFDQVAWDPQITYTQIGTTPVTEPTRTDVNGLTEFRYLASGDFTLAGRGASTVAVPLTGTLHLAGRFEKTAVTTDDVKLVITRNGIEVFSYAFGFAQTGTVDISKDVPVTMQDVLEWRIFVDSPIDATRVKLTPDAFYTAADGVDRVTDDQGNFVIRVSPPYDMDLYPVSTATAPQGFFTVPAAGTFPVQARVRVNVPDGETLTAAFTVKRRGALLAKRLLTFTGPGTPVEVIAMADVTVNAGDELFFDLSSRDPLFAQRLALLEVTFNGNVVPSASHTRAPEGLFPQPYRGWGAAGYNGNPPRDAAPIDQALLVITQTTTADNLRAFAFFPRPMDELWGGVDEQAFVKAGSMSSSRLGLDDIRVPTSAQFAGQSAPARISRSDNLSAAALVVGGSTGDSRSQLEFQDLNGDRFPDVISSNGGVQFSRAAGGLEGGRRGAGAGTARRADNVSVNLSLSAGGNIERAVASGRGHVAGDGVKSGVTAEQSSDMPRLGFGGSVSTGTSETQFDLIDINGDGLLDKVFRNGTASLNLGYSFAAAEPWNGGIVNDGQTLNAGVNLGFNLNFYSIAGGLNLNVGDTRSDETFVDVNGDGLPDKIVAGSPFTVRLNTGTGFTAPIVWPGGHSRVAVDKHVSLGGGVFFTFGFTFLGTAKVVFNPGFHTSASLGRPEVAFRDMDGDGFIDQVRSARDSELSVALNPIGRTNLLKKVHRPLGATFDIEYTRDGNRFDLPQSRWLMTRVSVFDGHVGEGADRQVTTYAYTGSNYNRLEREFFGYGTVVERHHDTQAADALFRSIQREYRTDSYYTKGLLARELTADALARPFVETQNTYLLRDVDTGAEPVDGSSTTATIFTQLSRTDKRFYEGGALAQKSTATLHQYDLVGNISHLVDTGDAGITDDVDAVISYTATDPACVATYIVGKARSILATGGGTLMRQREADIDCATGNLRQVRQFLASGQPAVTDLAYFPNGNIQTFTGPANKNGQRYRLDYVYDATVDTHVARITDSFGLFSTADYDLRFGQPTTIVDVNGQRTTNTYDAVGRIDTVVGPYEQGTAQVTIDFDYAPVATATSDSSGTTIPLAQAPFALTKHIDKDADGVLKSSGTIDTVLFTDGLKRIIQAKKDLALHTGPGGVPSDVMAVSGQLAFDSFGRTVRRFYPTTEPKGTNTLFNPSFDAVAPTTMTYDVLDRNTRTTIPDGTFTTLAYGFGADRQGQTQFQTTVTDANGKVKQSYRDVREQTTTVKELNQGGTLLTSYAYDALKQIVRVEDDKHNVTAIAYDNLGRRTIVDNPDAGRTETRYDLASNIIAKITANLRSANQQISYDYDFNRVTAIAYPSFPGNNVSYTYGAPGAAGDVNGNRAGRIARVTSQMGQEERFYGRLGEVVKEVKSIVTAQTPNAPEVYTTLYQFDTWNRLMRMTYPDGEVLTYAYDSGGQVNFAQGQKSGFTYSYLNRLEYDKFEARALVEFGNNVRTRYAYDARTRRLCGITSDKGSGATPGCVSSVDGTLPVQNAIQNLLYVYDNVGNITAIANSIPVPQPNQFGGPTKQTFAYDDLYRLTSSAGTYNFSPSKTRSYALNLGYDSIHNILSKSQSDVVTQPSGTPIEQKKTSYLFNYAYNPSGASSVRPHAPAHIGNRTFSYDANGNQTGWDNDDNGQRRTIVWDEENRIQSLFDNGHEKTYKYDDVGGRIIKRGPQGETVYVNQYFTIRNKEIGTKHVFADATRLVSKLMKQDKPGANPQGKTPVEKDLYFFHPDHLGSSHYITDTQGQIFEHLEYFPYGETWVEESTNTQRTPYLFTGKEFDEETSLYYFGARYYDPRTSVWQSADPIDRFNAKSPTIGLNLYQYGLLNPIRHFDPNGLFEDDALLKERTTDRVRPPTGYNRNPNPRVRVGIGLGLAAAALGTLQRASDTNYAKEMERQRGPLVNLDTGAVRNLISRDPAAIAATEAAIGGRQPVLTYAAVRELALFGQRNAGNPNAEALYGPNILGTIQDFIRDRVIVIPNVPSPQFMALRTTNRFDEADRMIFGTGHTLDIPTITSDAGAKAYIESSRINTPIVVVPSHGPGP